VRKIVYRQREPEFAERRAARDEFRVYAHRFQDLQSDLVCRKQLDLVAHQEFSVNVDEAHVFSQDAVYPEFVERAHDHCCGGRGIVDHVCRAVRAHAQQQFKGMEFELAVEYGLAPKIDLLGAVGRAGNWGAGNYINHISHLYLYYGIRRALRKYVALCSNYGRYAPGL